MELREVLERHRVVVCVGSGGVGKTTTSAAIALQAALSGKHALCLTIDPARRLANSLGLDELSHEPQRIAPELFAAQGLECRGSLSAMMLDMKHTFDALVTKHAATPAQRDRILNNRIYRYVSTSLAGTQEYMAMERLYEVRANDGHEVIVLDTPPTTNALDFLEAPQKLIGAIDSPVMRWFVQTLEEQKGLNLLGRSAAFVFKGLSRFTGSEFLHVVGEFVSEVNALFGGFRERADAVYQALRSPDVAFVIVTSPAPLSVREAVYFARKLKEFDIEPKAIVVNRVHAPLPEDGANGALDAALAQFVPDATGRADLLARMRTAAAGARAEAERDREGVRRLREHVGKNLSYTEVPAFDTDVHDLGALARVGEHLVGSPTAA
jgi:anion-transporting  ArsA/GET3 family ATPase